jgi:serine/threonine protein kinase
MFYTAAMYKQTTQVAVKQFKKGEKNLRIQQLLEIDHDNIIRFYGTFSDKENIGLVFDFMTNVDLYQYLHIKEGLELPKTELLSIAAQVIKLLQIFGFLMSYTIIFLIIVRLHIQSVRMLNTKRVIRIRISKNRQHNGKKKVQTTSTKHTH